MMRQGATKLGGDLSNARALLLTAYNDYNRWIAAHAEGYADLAGWLTECTAEYNRVLAEIDGGRAREVPDPCFLDLAPLPLPQLPE